MTKKSVSLAVIMGDIVGSEAAGSVRSLHRTFNKAIGGANKAHADMLASPLTITLGDEFQGLARTLASAWDIVSSLRLGLLQSDVRCRFVIGAVKVETPVNTERAWNMMGSGLSEARDHLNQKQIGNAYRFSLPEDALAAALLDAVGDSLTQIEADWTATQLKYFWASRSDRTNAKVAAALGVTERSLYKVLRAAQADFHARQSAAIAAAMRTLDRRYGLE